MKLTGPTGGREVSGEGKSVPGDVAVARAGWVRVERAVRPVVDMCL